MERKHKDILKQNFASVLVGKIIIVLDIEDNYQFGDPELIDMLKTCLHDYLQLPVAKTSGFYQAY